MNAQTLIDSTPSQTFEFSTFWKSNSSQVNTNSHQEGDEFVARQGNNKEHPATSSEGLYTSYPLDTNSSLMPQTPDLLSKININNIKNTETFKGDVIRSMGIEVL